MVIRFYIYAGHMYNDEFSCALVLKSITHMIQDSYNTGSCISVALKLDRAFNSLVPVKATLNSY